MTMTPLAASILGYILGLVTALLVCSAWLLVRGGREVREHERRWQDRFHQKGRW